MAERLPDVVVWTVVVTYHPGDDVADNLRAMRGECDRLLVVDNGSPADALRVIEALEGVELLRLEKNEGIARALNLGMARAEAAGAEWVLTFDQDSRPSPGFLAALLETAARRPDTALVGPFIEEACVGARARWLRRHPRCGLFFRCVPCDGSDLEDVSMVITSGALTSVRAWRELGGFDERLFIDYVDTDFCLRARRAGWRIAVCEGARLAHHLGRRELRRALGRNFFPTHHSPLRHYYIARNRVLMLGQHAFATPHWLAFECCSVAMWIFRVMAFEGRRRAKFGAMLIGTWDGLLGRYGACRPGRAEGLRR